MKKRYELESYIESQEGRDQLIKPMVIAPAMNTMMWDHPITNIQINQLKKWGCSIIDTV
jgi:phosphopantothenoylcysteine synthetase/decarboxylase